MGIRVSVDHDVCEANAVCEGILPEVFHVTDEDELEILQANVPAEFEEQVRDAVFRCPKAALQLHEN